MMGKTKEVEEWACDSPKKQIKQEETNDDWMFKTFSKQKENDQFGEFLQLPKTSQDHPM